ncbi:MAG: NAD(P)-binding domain-containing protein [Bacillota bacterium]
MKAKIGFIGMGLMGLPMATNLLKKSGETIIGFDVQETALATFKQSGGLTTNDVTEVYGSEIIFLCLPTNELVVKTVKEIIATAKEGTTIIDLSSSSPKHIRELYAEAKAKNISLIDSPVSGGDIGAIAGTLAIMCGGDKETFDKVTPLLKCIGATVTYIGESGAGDIAKLANNMIAGAYLLAISEGFAFATKAGLDPEVLYNAIKDGYAQSNIMAVKAPQMMKRDFTPGARIAVHRKDLKNALQFADDLGISIPVSELVAQYMDKSEEIGVINEDQCALVKIFEADMGTEVKAGK